MNEKKTQIQPPMQNIQMMREEPCEDDPNINIVMRSNIATGADKWKQLEADGWVSKATEKEVGFDLRKAKETFMEDKKSFS